MSEHAKGPALALYLVHLLVTQLGSEWGPLSAWDFQRAMEMLETLLEILLAKHLEILLEHEKGQQLEIDLVTRWVHE